MTVEHTIERALSERIVAFGRALRDAGQEREARWHFARLARRYLRSAASAHVRRMASEYADPPSANRPG